MPATGCITSANTVGRRSFCGRDACINGDGNSLMVIVLGYPDADAGAKAGDEWWFAHYGDDGVLTRLCGPCGGSAPADCTTCSDGPTAPFALDIARPVLKARAAASRSIEVRWCRARPASTRAGSSRTRTASSRWFRSATGLVHCRSVLRRRSGDARLGRRFGAPRHRHRRRPREKRLVRDEGLTRSIRWAAARANLVRNALRRQRGPARRKAWFEATPAPSSSAR